jgi:hypothetical protein
MNGFMPYTSSFIGATGQYPIYDYINSNITNTSNYVLITSNHLDSDMFLNSNILQTQIYGTSNLIYKDDNKNTIVKITAQNPYYPLTGEPKEMRFQNVNGDYITKITQTGELFVYHPSTPLPAGFGPGWWSVENKIATTITDTQGLRFDVTNLQAAAGTAAITDASTATATATAAATGGAAIGAATTAAGATIAGGNYGSVALGLAGGALFSVLGYLSYQAQIESNLTSNGFSNQASIVHSNISNANILVTDNISNICIAKGFINCNVTKEQYIPSIRTNDINIQGTSISNIYVSSNVLSNTSNILNNNIYTSSNILNNNIYISSNVLSNNVYNSSNVLNNYIYTSSNILNSNININSNNNYIYSSSLNNKINITLPSNKFWYDGINSVYCYDLNIEQYIMSSNLGNGYKSRSFRISTLRADADWRTKRNLLLNNEYINNPDILTIHMNNNSNNSGISTPNDNYTNGVILGKTKDTNIGYWNLVPNNYNYLRYITKVGWDTNVIIERLLP